MLQSCSKSKRIDRVAKVKHAKNVHMDFLISERLANAVERVYKAARNARQAQIKYFKNRTPDNLTTAKSAEIVLDKCILEVDNLLFDGEMLRGPEPTQTEDKTETPIKTSQQIADEAEIEAAKAANERISKY